VATDSACNERTHEPQNFNEALHQSQQLLASELDAAERLQRVATQLISADGTDALYEQILDAETAILHADFASIQQFYPERGTSGELRLLGHRGFSAEAAKRWEWVGLTARTSCGEALRTGGRVVVPDFRNCDFMAGSEDLDGYLSAGIQAGLTTPLVSRSGVLLGMVSAYWRQPHELSPTEMRSLDILARLAADFIERSRAEEVLRENRQRLASIYDTVRDAIFQVAVEPGAQFRFVSVNAAFLRITGLSREMVVGKTVNEVISEPSLTMALARYRQAIEEKTTMLWEETSDYPSGRLTGEVSVVPVFDDEGACTHLVGSVHNITERKRAEAALRESEERLRGSETRLKYAQRLARIGSWERDIESGHAYWSDEMFRIYGLRDNAAPTFSAFLNLVHPEDRPKLLEAHRKAGLSHAPVELEYRIIRPDGEVRCVRVILEAARNDSGEVVRTVGATQDITDHKRAQQEVFARQKLESVGALANGIAHDFNNLLGGVLAQTELAQVECAAGSSPHEELNAVRQLAIRGSEIVHQLMIYAGQEREASRLVDFSRIVEEMLALFRVSVSKHAVLEANLGKGLPPVLGSGAQMRQIVLNLVTNASEAIGEQDGVIRVTTGCVTLDRTAALAEGLAEGDYLQLKVSDTGCGMEPEAQARVFDPFFTTKSSGRGLGLSVVDGIVRGLHGVIHVASEPGKGTTFEILLPFAMSGETAAPIPPVGDMAHQFRQTTVLVVEDETSLREAIAKILRKNGFEVLEAHNGSAAIDLLRSNRNGINVILLDMTMPGPSSHEVVAEAVEARPDVRVILTSAYGEEIAKAAGSAPQIRGFLRKPFRLEELMQMLRNVLSSETIAQKEAAG
jgi:PAS domain S-box-containing protein